MNRLLSLFAWLSILLPSLSTPSGATGSTRPDSGNQQPESPYIQKVGEADKASNDGKWREAEKALMEAIEMEPDNPSNVLLMSNLGIIRFNMGQDSLALETLTEAHSIAPASVTILNNRATVLSALGMEDDAYRDYELIIGLDSMVITPRFHHCLLALRRHNFKTAVKDFEFMERHFPEATETHIAGASALSGTGKYAEAIPYYTKVLEVRKEPEFYGARGYCHMLVGNLQDASDDINSAIRLAPDDGELYLYRAALNKMRFRPDDAKSDAQKAIELGVDRHRATQFLDNQPN